MIVKADRDGSYYVADNGNWRLAGPFASNAAAWQWIDKHRPDHAIEPPNPTRPRMHIRKPRNNMTVDAEEVRRITPLILADMRSSVKEREFSLRMEQRAKRTMPLRLTDGQASWWRRLAHRYGGIA